ncbi:MAG: hypothetical protein QMD85_05360, partial [Candidatus Aenigmarchaeota archaeon]|nr:hypothetical protein [Candidatus Aenigmarchaeota archaeon]
MLRYDDLRDDVRRQQEAKRREEEKRSKLEEEKERKRNEDDVFLKILLRERSEKENERWGTPERAYDTWDNRTKGFIRLLNEYAASFRDRSKNKMRYYGNYEFSVEKDNDFFPFLFGEKKAIGTIRVSDFS